MTRASTKTVQMAFLRIGYQGFLTSADAAMKVAGLLQNAFACEESFDCSDAKRSYQVINPAEVELALTVKAECAASTPTDPGLQYQRESQP